MSTCTNRRFQPLPHSGNLLSYYTLRAKGNSRIVFLKGVIIIKDKTKVTLLTSGIIICGLSLNIVMAYPRCSEYEKQNEAMTNISNQLSDIQTEIQNLEKSREEDYEKRFKELADQISEIDKKFEEMHDENCTETIIFAEDVSEANVKYSKERLPKNIDTNRYDCEHYTFGIGSNQYYLQRVCYTDEKGLRYFYHNNKKYYCVAMGGAYGIDIGDIWTVTLECGSEFGIILSDFQHPITDIDPNDFGERYVRDLDGNIIDILRNYDKEPVIHVLEFVVDMESIPKSVAMAGMVNALPEFGGLYGDGGNIVDISYEGRVWSI